MTPVPHIMVLPLIAVTARIAGLAIAAPVFGSPSIPKIVRGAIILTLGFSAWTMTSGVTLAAVGPLGVLLILAGELAIGAIIGFFMSLPLVAVQMGGSLIGQQMSIALPSMLDPATGSESDELGRGFMMFAVVSFVVIGGIEQTYIAVIESFEHLPIATLGEQSIVTTMAGMMDATFEFGLRVALPIIAILMLQTAALAVVARSMPQINIFSIGMPLRMLVGFFILVIGLTIISQAISTFMPNMVGSVSQWVVGG